MELELKNEIKDKENEEEEDFFEDGNVISKIKLLHSEEDSEGILKILEKIGKEGDFKKIDNLRLISWPIPSKADIVNLTDFIFQNQIKSIYSIGCGSALLEWLLLKEIKKMSPSESSDPLNYNPVNLIGLEIDKKWWSSSYSPPVFIDNLLFAEEVFLNDDEPFGNEESVAIFAYFNNLQVFIDYLKRFQGRFVIIIGPLYNAKKFCHPNPLDLCENPKIYNQEACEGWKLISCDKFGWDEFDYIGFYIK